MGADKQHIPLLWAFSYSFCIFTFIRHFLTLLDFSKKRTLHPLWHVKVPLIVLPHLFLPYLFYPILFSVPVLLHPFHFHLPQAPLHNIQPMAAHQLRCQIRIPVIQGFQDVLWCSTEVFLSISL